ncbi:ribbon-helix-helix protein, CopG family [Fischerella sp. PCC 9605]|uniref:ribbon-helix-helix protein, CopG family n=1 Tax=Fischerella sp. PCC 9605 TaxID=1173024 RepID=UPI00047A08FC|nr:ribbon-helix-helix protein, CopG family [Fischerella sp. PCC 9605]
MGKKKHGRYEEPKERVNISLTLTAIARLDLKASQAGVSRSELIEMMARQENLHISDPERQLLGK